MFRLAADARLSAEVLRVVRLAHRSRRSVDFVESFDKRKSNKI
jgi:hypothetical protein